MNASENLTSENADTEDLYTDDVLNSYVTEYLIIRITVEIISIISILCVFSNIFACFIIFKFRRLRNDPSYKIIANWFILNSIFMLTSPLVLRSTVDWHFSSFFTYEFYCIVEEIHTLSFLGLIFVMILLTFHWFFKLYHPLVSNKYDRFIIYFILVVNLILFFCLIQGIVSCNSSRSISLNTLITIGTFLIFNIFMIIMNIINFCKKKILGSNSSHNIPYIFSNVFFLSFLFSLVVMLVYAFSGGPTLVLITVCISFLLSFACPIYFFLLLYKYEKNFNAFTRHIVTCRCTKYSGDEFVDQPVHYNNQQQA